MKRDYIDRVAVGLAVLAVAGAVVYVTIAPLRVLPKLKETAKQERHALEEARIRADTERERIRTQRSQRVYEVRLGFLEAPIARALYCLAAKGMDNKFKPTKEGWDFDFSDMFEGQSPPTGDLSFSFWPKLGPVEQPKTESHAAPEAVSLRRSHRSVPPDARVGSYEKSGEERAEAERSGQLDDRRLSDFRG